MQSFIKFIALFIVIYLVLSLPTILGFGVAIDFVEGVSWVRKVKAYFITGIVYGYSFKMLISLVTSIGLIVLFKLKKK